MKSKNSETAIGLDIGPSSVKCVEVVRADGAIELRQAFLVPVAGEADVKAVLEKFSGRAHVRTALSGPSVVTRVITMPALTAKELAGAIRFEAESHIPFPVDDCVLDYHVMKQDGPSRQITVLLAAAKRDLVEARWKLFSEAGIQPEVFDLDVFCLINAFEALHTEEPEKNYGLLNIGHSFSSMAIVHEGLPVFSREIAHGSLQVTRALAEMRGIAEEQAEELKVRRPSSETEALKAAAEKGFESLAEEVRHSIDFFENQEKTDLKKLYLSGGGALAAGALEVLSGEIGKPCAHWDNTKKLKIHPEAKEACAPDVCGRFNIALGMALRPGFRK